MLKQLFLLWLLCFATIGVNSSQPAKVDQSNYETNFIAVNDDITTSHAFWLTQDENLYQTDYYAP
jgi:hypothetical protein